MRAGPVPTPLPTQQSGGSTTRKNLALTGRQIEALVRAANQAVIDHDLKIGPAKVNRLIRRFVHHLNKSGMGLREFLADTACQRKLRLVDPELAYMLTYLDPTGELAVNRVLHQRNR